MGVLWQLEPFDLVDEKRLRHALERVDAPPVLVPEATTTSVLLALGAIVGLFALLQVLSIVWAVVKFHGFTLRLAGDDLRADYGLLTRISATIPLHRIQLLSWRHGPLHRLFGRVSVLVETAGGGARSEDGSDVERLWIAPALPAARLGELLDTVLPDVRPAGATWQPVASGARRRIFRRGAIAAIVAAVVSAPLVGAWAALVLVLGIALAWVHADRWFRHARWAELPHGIAWHSGWWTRRASVVPYGKVQVLSLRASPFDRRSGMRSLYVDTAGAGRAGHPVDLRYLPEATATRLVGRLESEAGSRPFRW
jgi:putative membrane protein